MERIGRLRGAAGEQKGSRVGHAQGAFLVSALISGLISGTSHHNASRWVRRTAFSDTSHPRLIHRHVDG
jgi:hypothetical protein